MTSWTICFSTTVVENDIEVRASGVTGEEEERRRRRRKETTIIWNC
jgi:hypothetical protein